MNYFLIKCSIWSLKTEESREFIYNCVSGFHCTQEIMSRGWVRILEIIIRQNHSLCFKLLANEQLMIVHRLPYYCFIQMNSSGLRNRWSKLYIKNIIWVKDVSFSEVTTCFGTVWIYVLLRENFSFAWERDIRWSLLYNVHLRYIFD